MFWKVFRFELAFHARQPMIYVVSLIFFLLSFGATVSDNITVGVAADNININSPFNIVMTAGIWSFLAMFGCVAYAASPVLRDFDYKVAELFLTTRIRKFDYLVARFCGALVFCVAIYVMALLGMLLGEFMPWLDPERLGPVRLDAYWFATWVVALPNILFISTLVFVVATLSRSLMASYVAVIALLIVNALVGTLVEPDQVRLLSMLDPFGMEAIAAETRYWTPYQRNEELVSLTGNLLANRLLVTGLIVSLAVAGYRLFRFSLDGLARPRWFRRKASRQVRQSVDDSMTRQTQLLPAAVTTRFDMGAHFRQLVAMVRMEMRNIMRGKAFIIFALMGMVMIVMNAVAGISAMFGTDLYPTTSAMVLIINGAYSIPLIVVLVFYSSELFARDRDAGLNELVDSMPFPSWVAIAAKLFGLIGVITVMLLAAMAAAIAIQLGSGFFDINLGQYLLGLFLFFQFPLWLTCVIALFLQVLTGSRYLGMFFTVLYLIGIMFIPNTGFDQFLYLINIPSPLYSDFTGYDLGLERFIAFSLYWGFFVGLLLAAAHLLWQRGTEAHNRFRWQSIKARFTRPTQAVTAVCLIGFIAVGSFIYYNTNVLNIHLSRLEREELQADYEKRYKQYERQPQPAIDHVNVAVDIFPERKEVHVEGSYRLVNKGEAAISELHLSLLPNLNINAIEIEGSSQTLDDRTLGFASYQLEPAMQPGEARHLKFNIDWLTPGIANNIPTRNLLSNGTFFNNFDVLPIVGYNPTIELSDDNRRRKYDLPELERMAKIDDQAAWQYSQLGAGYRTGYEAVVSTSADQIAVTPGYLVKEWEKEGRRYFHYKMDQPIWPFVSFMSASFEVARSEWQGVDLEVYYHHDYNVQRMLEAAEKSLGYFSENFAPYQYQQFRIFEFPAPVGRFAQSFPNTIPFSEAVGFVADIRDPEEIDYVFYVTAHELAHQWWAHQVIGADVQGSTVFTETLAQYSALMVMEQEYGKDYMQRFLRYELDNYLRARGGERIEELPLMLVENQPYIHYRKGSLVMYALQDYLGAELVNNVLRQLIADWGFKGPPYPTTRHLLSRLQEAAGPKHQAMISDLFEKIVVYDLKVDEAEYRAIGDDKYEVSFTVNAVKYEADGEGKESEVAIADLIDIAVLGAEQGAGKIPEVLHLEKQQISEQNQHFTVVVDKQPKAVGIDPYNKLIDRNPEDNRKSLAALAASIPSEKMP